MKHVIEVPAGHTVQISRRGNRVTVESAESNDQLSPVGGLKFAGAPSATEEVINMDLVTPKVYAPGIVVVYAPGIVVVWEFRKPFTENEKLREFIVYGSDNKPTCMLDSEKVLKVNPVGFRSNQYAIRTSRIATPAEREEFLNNLRDWYALTINESGELVNWRAKRRDKYYYINYVACPEYDVEGLHDLDNETNGLGNYFPEGFLTAERLTEYKATVQKLFNKWRGLCSK